MSTQLIPLSQIKAGQTVKIKSVTAGHGLKHRLSAMGLLPNMKIKVMQNEFNGQLIVSIKNTKIVLGRGMSGKIMVSKLDQE